MLVHNVWFSKLIIVWLFSVALLEAHDPGLSTAVLSLDGQRLDARLTFSPADLETLIPLDTDQDGQVTSEEFEGAETELKRRAGEALDIRIDGRAVTLAETQVRRRQQAENDNVEIELHYRLRKGELLSARSRWLSDLPLGHRQYLSLLDQDGDLLGQRLLGARSNVFETTLAGSAGVEPGWQSFKQFLVLGVEHIVTGYDHLLFLVGLLVVGGSFVSAAKIITSFTVAHSITLALATLSLVRVPPQVVEPLIAVSIIYVGLENIFGRILERRWVLTFGFGLVHGLGFASVLRDLGISSEAAGVVLPLLSFNLGVELGQVAIAVFVLYLIGRLNRRPSLAPRYVQACSAAVTLAGGYWLIERVL